MSNLTELNGSNFAEVTGKGLVLVDFWAEWCGPCKMLMPALEQLAAEVDGKAVIAKVNVDANPEIAAKFMVRTIPALFLFKNGEIVWNGSGVQSKSALAGVIQANQ